MNGDTLHFSRTGMGALLQNIRCMAAAVLLGSLLEKGSGHAMEHIAECIAVAAASALASDRFSTLILSHLPNSAASRSDRPPSASQGTSTIQSSSWPFSRCDMNVLSFITAC
ncbi:hypothetical protein N658DRAFT_21736 [Parathielavia hyrcaniae]|uniref:Uncharacterized protein n=1 Tax=Parathielavia hyrcaniae TaxID=113614 RepID=A0AAN6QFZ3_9PEZI|nr:hypothetical protein N658DRAFT_21736 [Parathielavia hyrcaniae]